MKQITLNRKKYNQIRKMDHQQMQEYFKSVYDSGYAAGVKAASEEREIPELIGLDEELQAIRGIGCAKARLICEKVKDFLEKRSSKDESSMQISGQ